MDLKNHNTKATWSTSLWQTVWTNRSQLICKKLFLKKLTIMAQVVGSCLKVKLHNAHASFGGKSHVKKACEDQFEKPHRQTFLIRVRLQ